MDSLYSEISATIAERVMPIVTAPYAGADWRANLRDLTQRRVRVFEAMLPFRLAANIKRYQSPFLMAEYTRVVRLERELVLRLLPDPGRADRTRDRKRVVEGKRVSVRVDMGGMSNIQK